MGLSNSQVVTLVIGADEINAQVEVVFNRVSEGASRHPDKTYEEGILAFGIGL